MCVCAPKLCVPIIYFAVHNASTDSCDKWSALMARRWMEWNCGLKNDPPRPIKLSALRKNKTKHSNTEGINLAKQLAGRKVKKGGKSGRRMRQARYQLCTIRPAVWRNTAQHVLIAPGPPGRPATRWIIIFSHENNSINLNSSNDALKQWRFCLLCAISDDCEMIVAAALLFWGHAARGHVVDRKSQG